MCCICWVVDWTVTNSFQLCTGTSQQDMMALWRWGFQLSCVALWFWCDFANYNYCQRHDFIETQLSPPKGVASKSHPPQSNWCNDLRFGILRTISPYQSWPDPGWQHHELAFSLLLDAKAGSQDIFCVEDCDAAIILNASYATLPLHKFWNRALPPFWVSWHGIHLALGCTQHSCDRRGQESWRLPLLVETQTFQWNWSLLVFTAQLLEVFHCPGFRIFFYDSSFSKALRVRTFPPTDRCTCSSNQVKLHTSTTRMARSNLGPGF